MEINRIILTNANQLPAVTIPVGPIPQEKIFAEWHKVFTGEPVVYQLGNLQWVGVPEEGEG